MTEAWFFDTLLPLLLFIGIFGLPLALFVKQRVTERTRPRERRHG